MGRGDKLRSGVSRAVADDASSDTSLITARRGSKSTTSVMSLNLRSSKVKKDEALLEPVLITQLSWSKSPENLQCFFSYVNRWLRYLYSTSRNKQVFQSLCTPSKKSFSKYFYFLYVPFKVSSQISSYDAHLATAPQHIPTQHDMLPQHLLCKYELNCEYCNITLARNKAPWWWSDKIETCRSVLKVFYMKLYVYSLVDKLKWCNLIITLSNKVIVLT